MSNAQSGFRRFWQSLRLLYASSLTCGLLQRLKLLWTQSWFCTSLFAALAREPVYRQSRLRETKLRFDRWLTEKCASFGTVLRRSNLYRIYAAVFRAGQNSRIAGGLFSHGLTAVFLLLIGGYVVLDYVLRDVLVVPGLSSFWDELLLLLALVWVFYLKLTRSTPGLGQGTPLDTPVSFFLCVCVVLLAFTFRYPAINIAGLRATAQYILWFFIVSRLIRDDRDLKQLYLTMVVIAAVIGLHGIYQYIVGAPIPENWVDQAEAAVRTRVYSIFSSCNIMGDYMVLFAPMAAGIVYAAKEKWIKILAAVSTLVMCVSCLLTMSRGAWVAMLAAIVLFAVLVDLRLLVLMFAACVLALFLPFVQSRIGYLFTDAFAASSNRAGRSVRWSIAMQYLFDSDPLLGLGFGRFGGAIAMQNQTSPTMTYFYTDNYYVKTLTENGFVGLFAFVAMMAGVLWTGLKSWFQTRQKKSRCAPLCAGMLSGLTGVLVHCYFENIFEEPYMAVCFWTVAAMLMYLGFLRKPKQER